MSSLVRNGDILEITLTGRWSEISDAKEKVKDIPGRRWDPEKKVWTVPAEPHVADRVLKTIRPDADEELLEWVRESMTSAEETLTTPLPPDADLLIPWSAERCDWQPETVNDETFDGLTEVQRSGVDAIARWGRALLCDDMGLGKTLTMISADEEYRLRNKLPDGITMPEGPRLIIAPASVLGSWSRELYRWLEEPNVQLVDAATPQKRHEQVTQGIRDDAWIVVNWEQLRVKKVQVKKKTRGGGMRKQTFTLMKEPLFQWPQAHLWDLSIKDWEVPDLHAKALKDFKHDDPYFLSVFADEIHRAKNRYSQQTQGLHRTRGQLMVGATGTPVMNSPDELWALLRWLWPDEYHERGAAHMEGALAFGPFYDLYVEGYEDHFGRKYVTGVKNPDALRHALKGKIIRRLADWEHGGKRRIYYDTPLTAKQRKIYDEAEKAIWLAVQEDAVAGNAEALELYKKAMDGATTAELMRIPNGAARFVRLQQIIENAALIGGPDESSVMDDFQQKYEDSRPEPWVVFCKYKASCDLLAERLRKKYGARVEVYNGDVRPRDRTQIEDEFQAGNVDVLIGTIDAMYQGITLTRSHLQHWLSRSVVPAHNEQGEDRENRKGQQKQVQVYIPQAPDTVATDKVHVINRRKEAIVKTVVDKAEIEEV